MDSLSDVVIRDNIHELLEAYLRDRYKDLSVNDLVSDREVLKYGVPHGSVPGPTSFNIYVDIPTKLLW